MKKLMIAAAIVCAAAMSQASSVNWTCTNVKDTSGNAVAGVAYFMVETVAQTRDQFIANVAGKGATAAAAALGSAYSYSSSAAGTYTVPMGSDVDVKDLGISDNSSYKAYLVIFDNEDMSKANFYVTAVKDLETVDGSNSTQVKWGTQSTPSQQAANWHAVAAPEPTSGLLLLLGVAGLALRRRRA